MLRRSLFVLFLAPLIGLLSVLPCRALELSQPIRCAYGRGCFVQNYVDVDATPEWHDFTCGQLSYDGHKGTDFRVPWADYMAGVEVLAAAPGVVLRVRDGVEDRDARGHEDEVRAIGLGNAVILEHEDGYVTIYAHMKQGSVRVREGEAVTRGQVLGLVGMSGLTTFPHLHFGVNHNDVVVCPFLGEVGSLTGQCGADPAPLWALDTRLVLHYISSGLIQAGFLGHRPELPALLRQPAPTMVASDSPVLVFAVTVFGVRAGDEVRMRILDPSGAVFARSTQPMEKNQAQRLVYIGRKLVAGAHWPPGVYRGEYQLIRDDKIEVQAGRTIEVR